MVAISAIFLKPLRRKDRNPENLGPFRVEDRGQKFLEISEELVFSEEQITKSV
jgi:hypothetical protein